MAIVWKLLRLLTYTNLESNSIVKLQLIDIGAFNTLNILYFRLDCNSSRLKPWCSWYRLCYGVVFLVIILGRGGGFLDV